MSRQSSENSAGNQKQQEPTNLSQMCAEPFVPHDSIRESGCEVCGVMPVLRHPNSVAEDGANVEQKSNLETHTKQMLCFQVGTQMS